MEAHSHFGRAGNARSANAFANRKISLLVALLSALLAGVLIYLFVTHYRKTTVAPPATETVFVAKQYIPEGTPESTIASGGMLTSKVIPVSQAFPGVVTDPSVLTGSVATAAIVAGQQVTVSDFTHVASLGPLPFLRGTERAIGISVDSWHGLTAYLAQGNTVDVIAQAKHGSEELFQDVTVLENQGGNVVLELTDKQTLLLTAALQRGVTLWLTLRPASGATNSVHVGQIVGVN